MDTQDYEGVLGKGVRSSTGEDMGRIIDIILDKDGRPRAAIIDFGGFLGVGSRKIAVDWRSMRFSPDGKPSRLVLQLSRNQVRVSPEYKPGDPIVVLGPASPSVPPDGEPAPATASSQVPAAQAPVAQPAAPVQAPVATPPSAASSPAPDKPAERTPDK
ncbi:PRC-barrel domain-containing protein [Methylobacterium sp. 10]|uniref:PRC-barrel domain-containing protein n=1 Tax=Methylobacterium sp. 10 TaxID=1101191 RepID=UPI0004B2C809